MCPMWLGIRPTNKVQVMNLNEVLLSHPRFALLLPEASKPHGGTLLVLAKSADVSLSCHADVLFITF